MMTDVVVYPPDTASPKDPNELSFGRGEIFKIIDKSGKWWEAEMADGRKGSKSCLFSLLLVLFIDVFILCPVVPSNYLRLL